MALPSIAFRTEVRASMKPGRLIRSAYFISGAAALNQSREVIKTPQQRRNCYVEHEVSPSMYFCLLKMGTISVERALISCRALSAPLPVLLKDFHILKRFPFHADEQLPGARMMGSAGINCGWESVRRCIRGRYSARTGPGRARLAPAPGVRIDGSDFIGLGEQIDIDHLKVHTLLVEHDAATVT